MEFKELLKLKIDGISAEAAEKFECYFDLLIDHNSRINLTAITEREEVIEKHFKDSLLPLSLIPQGAKCIDIGTGAGFPGIPLAIMRSDIKVVLLDSLNKRVNFLKEAAQKLALPLVCIHARGEEAAHLEEYRGKFDIALSRAVSGINTLCEVSVPYLKVGGTSIMLKGPKAEEELKAAQNALKALNAEASIVHFDAEWGERCAVTVKKTAPTAKQYPRKGMFKKPIL